MAKTKKRNVYRRLIVWMLVLLALAALACAGYLYTRNYLDQRIKENAEEVNKINTARIDAYNEAVLDANRQNAPAQAEKTWPAPAADGWDVVDVSTFPISAGSQTTVSRSELLQGGMLVVNRWYAMPADLSDDMVVSVNRHSRADNDKTTNLPTKDASVSMMAPAVEALMSLYKDARAGGLDMDNIIIGAGYRSMETQSKYWQAEVDKYSARYSGDRLTEKARQTTAYPGTSDYQAGMSFEVYNYKSGDSAFSNTPLHETEQGKWLYNNAWKYGYVFRFPVQGFPYPDTVDKSFKTGISMNLKVYRYVGVGNAAVMHCLNLCMEEYVEYLMAHPHIAVYENGGLRYEIYRIEGGFGDTAITVPNGAKNFSASSDNVGGVIVVISY